MGHQCEEEAGHILTDCYTECHGDEYCITKCIRDYDYHTFHCPCDGGCPDGCPCPVYECPGYTTVRDPNLGFNFAFYCYMMYPSNQLLLLSINYNVCYL